MRRIMIALGTLGTILLFDGHAAAQPGRILVDNTGPSILGFNIDGSNGFTIVGNTDNNAVFSPSVAGNGTIAFTANTNPDGTYLGHPFIFLMNADGTNVRNITPGLPGSSSNCCYDLSPAMSPDGTTVAFLATINVAPDGSQVQEIYLVNADGSNLRQLTPFMDNPNTNPPIGDYSQSAMSGLVWSPDSTRVAFRGSVYTSQCGTYGGQAIFVNVIGTINADGTGMQFLACDGGDGYVTAIDWSPDGSLLAWGRNVSHGAQGCSGCVGEPAISFYDFSGQSRYQNGITSGALGTDSCQGGPHCIHFSPGSNQLAYVDAYPGNGNPCQSSCNVSFINLDGTGHTNSTIPSGGRTVWWQAGAAIPAPAQMAMTGSVPTTPAVVEVWTGSPQQLIPTLSDSSSNLILHTAAGYTIGQGIPGQNTCLNIGPYGLALYVEGGGNGFNQYNGVFAANAGLNSNPITVKCWRTSPCTFMLGSNYTDIPASGGTGMVTVTADPGSTGSTCPWSATTSASWIMITSGASGSGNGSVNFSVGTNSGAARQDTITIAGLTYNVSQDAAGSGASLTSITVTPNPAFVAAGSTLQFTATGNYSDSSMKNLTASVAWTSSNTGIATVNSTGLTTGAAAGGPVTITAALNGISGTAQLTVTAPVLQSITVSPATASIAAGLTQQFAATGHYSDGSTQTLTAQVSWASSNTSIATINSSGLAAGVVAGGPVTITATQGATSGTAQLTVTGPFAVSVSPGSGTGLTQTFTAVYSDPNGISDLMNVIILFNATKQLSNACAVLYQPATNKMYLYNNAGNGLSAAVVPGSSSSASNTQCTLSGMASSFSTSGINFILNVALTFSSTFTGQKGIFLYAAGKTSNSGLVAKGTWTPAPAAPKVISLAPTSGTGVTQSFTGVFSDPNGLADLKGVIILFNTTVKVSSACAVLYAPSINKMFLYNDAGTGYSTGVIPGSSSTASNSQCTLSGMGSSLSISGNQLTISAAITFAGAFTGQKNVYLYAAGKSASSGFSKKGTWTP